MNRSAALAHLSLSGALTTILCLVAAPALAQPERDIDITGLEIVASDEDAALFQAVVEGQPDIDLAALSSLDVESASLSEWSMSRQDTTLVLSGIRFTGIAGGVADRIEIDAMRVEETSGATSSYDATTVSGLDVSTILAFADLIEAPETDQLSTLYQSVTHAGGNFSGPEGKCRLGAAQFGHFSMRTGLDWSRFAELEADQEPSPELLRDLFSSFSMGPIESGEIVCKISGPREDIVDFSLASFTTEAFEPGIIPAIEFGPMTYRIDEGNQQPGTFDIESFAFHGANYAHLLTDDQDDGMLGEFEAVRRTMPHIYGMTMTGLSTDIPDGFDRIVLSIDEFDLRMDEWLNGLPTSFTMAVVNQSMDMASMAGGEEFAALTAMFGAMGSELFNSSFDIAVAWNADEGTIDIDSFTYDFPSLGTASFAGQLGNVDETLFSYDETEMLAAAMEIGLLNSSFEIVDRGAMAFFATLAAMESGMSEADMRAEMAEQVVADLIVQLEETPGEILIEPVAAFVREGGRLLIEIASRSGDPVTVDQIEAAEPNVKALFDLFEIEAEGSPAFAPPTAP